MPHRGETEAQAETRRLAFETRRDQAVLDRLYEVERDTDFNTVELYHVPYYQTLEEQNQFLNSIAHTQFGSTLLRVQERFTRDRVPMIIPKFSNTRLKAITTSTVYDYTFPNITKKEEQFLIAMNLGISEDINGKYVTGTNKTKDFRNIINDTFKYNEEIATGVISDPSISPGYRTNTLKYGYEEPEPQVVTEYIEPVEITPTSTQKKSESVFQPPEPEVTTDHIQPLVEAEPEKLYEVYGQTLPLSESAVDYYESLGVSVTTSQVDPPIEEAEPQVTTSQVEPPGVEEPEVITSQVEPPVEEVTEPITSQVDPPGQEVTAQISWFGNTWFPWHLELEDRRRR